MGNPTRLVCGRCKREFPPGEAVNLCSCGAPLLVHYDLARLRTEWSKGALTGSPTDMWRYEPVLPCPADEAVRLGEGWTPLQTIPQLGRQLGAGNLWIKDEGRNPTDSFKARGMSTAVSMARKLGFQKLAAPSAGNAASALAAYAARAGCQAHIFMPSDVPQANYIECKAFGAQVTLVDGLISDCARIVAERAPQEGWFEVSTLKEPYRIEGKKTMGYELAEQLGWQVPDAILYPCGGGVGLIGIAKAFDELEELGWIGAKRPKMIAVQAAGCAPLVRAFEHGAGTSEFWQAAFTVASGLRVPKPIGDFLILRAVRDSAGTVIAVPDEEILAGGVLLAAREGIFAAPETGACIAALPHLLENKFLKPDDEIVVLSTGSGLKYLEAYSTRFIRHRGGEGDKLGGLITPR